MVCRSPRSVCTRRANERTTDDAITLSDCPTDTSDKVCLTYLRERGQAQTVLGGVTTRLREGPYLRKSVGVPLRD